MSIESSDALPPVDLGAINLEDRQHGLRHLRPPSLSTLSQRSSYLQTQDSNLDLLEESRWNRLVGVGVEVSDFGLGITPARLSPETEKLVQNHYEILIG